MGDRWDPRGGDRLADLGWRPHFPALAEFNHLDLANRAPMPDVGYQAVLEYLDDIHRQGGDKDAWKARVERARVLYAELIGAQADDVAFLANTSDALNAVANSVDWSPGDNLVVSAGEHPNNLYPWVRLRNRGVDVREIRVTDRPLEASDYFVSMDAKTRLVAASLVSYDTGQRLPIESIGARCREIGALMVVDGVQAVGILDINVSRMNIDALACGSQKGLLAGYGIGVLYVDPRVLPALAPAYAARASLAQPPLQSDGRVRFAPAARRFEIGNLNYSTCFAVEAALRFILRTGIAAIEAGVRARCDYLLCQARRLGISPAIALRNDQRSGVLVLAHRHPVAAQKALLKLRVLVTACSGGIRVAPHLYNDEENLDRFLHELSKH